MSVSTAMSEFEIAVYLFGVLRDKGLTFVSIARKITATFKRILHHDRKEHRKEIWINCFHNIRNVYFSPQF